MASVNAKSAPAVHGAHAVPKGTNKRKASSEISKDRIKKHQAQDGASNVDSDQQTLERHGQIMRELSSKYNIVTVSVISSSKIQQRVRSIKNSLATSTSDKPVIVLVHSRPKEACKVITIVELCKRLNEDKIHQYNELFELPEGQVKPSRRDKIDETVLPRKDGDDPEDSDEDDFEVMQQSRFVNAVIPTGLARKTKSLRVFLSAVPVPELKARPSVNAQQ